MAEFASGGLSGGRQHHIACEGVIELKHCIESGNGSSVA